MVVRQRSQHHLASWRHHFRSREGRWGKHLQEPEPVDLPAFRRRRGRKRDQDVLAKEIELTRMGNSKLALLLIFFVCATAWGQSADRGSSPSARPTPTPASTPPVDDDSRRASDNPVKFLRNLAHDQK